MNDGRPSVDPVEVGQSESVASASPMAHQNGDKRVLVSDDTPDGSELLRNPSRLEPAEAIDPFGMLDYIFGDLSTEIAHVDFNAQVLPDALFTTDWSAQRLPVSNLSMTGGVSRCDESIEPSIVGVSADPPPAGTLSSAGDHHWDSLSGSHAMCRVPEWLSTKESIWSCFHYLVNSARAIPNSPLCHGILSWTYAYLSRSNATLESARAEHYATASASVQLLSNELCGSPDSGPSAWRTVNRSDQLSLYVSSTFFLCHHDLMTGHYASFATRMYKSKTILQRHWAEGTTPGAIESRIVIWLAFLELRFFFLGGEIFSDPGPQNDLMTILTDLKAVPVLRRVHNQQSVLSECFGNGLPQEENEEDLRKDRCRLKFDDLMYYLARVRRFEIWDTEHEQRRLAGEALLQELRDAKVEALRAELGRLQAVSFPHGPF